MIFKQRKNKQFNYKPRHSQDKEADSKPNFELNWVEESRKRKQKTGKLLSLPYLIGFLIMVIVLWCILSNYETNLGG